MALGAGPKSLYLRYEMAGCCLFCYAGIWLVLDNDFESIFTALLTSQA